MKSLHLLLAALLFFCFSVKAENRFFERVYVHTDKDCYIAGENVLLKFYVIDNRFQPSGLSKVGYVEICNTERPLMQHKVALEKGSGAGAIKIPANLPSGMYQLSGYTRYMRNEGENAFFGKQIAIVNAGQQLPDPKRFELVEKKDTIFAVKKESGNLSITTDQNEYHNRQQVNLSIDHIPANIASLVISVTGNDSIVFVPEINNSEWLKQVTDTFPFSGQWLPEYEGHIISGRIAPEPQEELLANIAFVGNDIRYFNGQANAPNGTINFYTAGIFGKQQIVTSAASLQNNKVPYRVDLLTPFCEFLPVDLPVLQIYPREKQVMDRYIGVQIQEKAGNDFLYDLNQIPDYCTFQPVLSYDLDEYTRFATISETILEFVSKVQIIKVGDKRRISVLFKESQRFSPRTLVLLDGIPVYDHEEMIEYNPVHIKKINIYDERYMFGGRDFEGIISFLTKESNLPFFQLSNESQLYIYDCPQLPSLIKISDYSTDTAKNSKHPDFRHTLYWNPFVDFSAGQPVNLSFYTSDLCGEFKIKVEGITTSGKMIRGISYFQVFDK